MFTCIKPCYACIIDSFYNKNHVGSIYNSPDPLIIRGKKYKRFIKGDVIDWVDPCSRDYFRADSASERVTKEEAAALRKGLIALGVTKSSLNGLDITELAESYERHFKVKRKTAQTISKKKTILTVPENPGVDAEREGLLKKLVAVGENPPPNTSTEKLKAKVAALEG